MSESEKNRGPNFYDQQYFDPHPGHPRKSNYERYVDGRRYYLTLATSIACEFLGRRILSGKQSVVIDIGCAKGYLVKALNKLPSITAFGIDFSNYAITHSPPQTHGHVFLADARQLPLNSECVDLVVSMDMFEHLTLKGIQLALTESHRILKPNSPFFALIAVGKNGENDQDKSHITIQSPKWWAERFQEHGFKPINTNPLSIVAKAMGPFWAAYKTLSRPGVMAFSK